MPLSDIHKDEDLFCEASFFPLCTYSEKGVISEVDNTTLVPNLVGKEA